MSMKYKFLSISLASILLAAFLLCLMSTIKINKLKECINKLEEKVEDLSKEKEILKEENKKLNVIAAQEKMEQQIIISNYKMRYIITSNSNTSEELNLKMLQMSVDFIISLVENDLEYLEMLCTEQFYNELMLTANINHELELTEGQKAYKRISDKNLMKFSHITNASEYQDKYLVFIYFYLNDIEEMMDGVITFCANEDKEILVEKFGINK